jgi:hypothetical protein
MDEYVIAGYLVTAVTLVVYSLSFLRRERALRKEASK